MSTHTGAHARTMICRKLLLNDDVTSMLSHNLSGSVDRSFQHSKHSNWSILPGRIRCKNVQQFFSFFFCSVGFITAPDTFARLQNEMLNSEKKNEKKIAD